MFWGISFLGKICDTEEPMQRTYYKGGDHKNDLVFDNGAETITARRISITLEVQ